MRVFVGLLLIILGVTLIFAGASSSGLNLLSAILGNSGNAPKSLQPTTGTSSDAAQQAINNWIGNFGGAAPGSTIGNGTQQKGVVPGGTGTAVGPNANLGSYFGIGG